MQTYSQEGFNWGGAFEGGQTFVADSYNSTLGFLSDGLNVYKDYLDIKGGSQVPAQMSPSQWAEQARPVDSQAAQSSTIQQRQWVPGVSNGVVMIGAAAALLLLMK